MQMPDRIIHATAPRLFVTVVGLGAEQLVRRARPELVWSRCAKLVGIDRLCRRGNLAPTGMAALCFVCDRN